MKIIEIKMPTNQEFEGILNSYGFTYRDNVSIVKFDILRKIYREGYMAAILKQNIEI